MNAESHPPTGNSIKQEEVYACTIIPKLVWICKGKITKWSD